LTGSMRTKSRAPARELTRRLSPTIDAAVWVGSSESRIDPVAERNRPSDDSIDCEVNSITTLVPSRLKTRRIVVVTEIPLSVSVRTSWVHPVGVPAIRIMYHRLVVCGANDDGVKPEENSVSVIAYRTASPTRIASPVRVLAEIVLS